MNLAEEDFNSISDLQDTIASCIAGFVYDNPKFKNCSFTFKVTIEDGWVSCAEVNFVDNEI